MSAIRQQVQALYSAWLWGDVPGAEEARRYLLGRHTGGRGIAREVALTSGIGYVPAAPDGGGAAHALAPAMAQQGATERELREVSVVCAEAGTTGTQDFPPGGGYLVFPIRAITGDILGFKYRAVPGIARADGLRYTGTSGGMGGAMFGWERWTDADRRVIAVEGEIDQLSIETVRLGVPGLPRPLAWYGKELTDERLRFLDGRVAHVLLALDADGGGWDGMLRSGRKLGQAGIPHQVLRLPKGLDPNDVLTLGSPDVLAHFIARGPRCTLVEAHAQHLLTSGIAAVDPVYAAHALRDTWAATRTLVSPHIVDEVARQLDLPAKLFQASTPSVAPRVQAAEASAAAARGVEAGVGA